MTKNIRRPLLTLGILTAFIGFLSAGCSSSDAEAGIVRSVAISETVTDNNTSEIAGDTSDAVAPQSEPIRGDVSVVWAAEAGEDAFAIEDRSGTTIAQTATPNDLVFEMGMPYAEARERILQQGWVPEEGPEPGPYGGERALYEAGFTEVDSCSGTGLGPCLFYFSHPERTGPNEENILRVLTYGGSSRPEIADWSTHHNSGTPSTNAVVAEIPVQFQGTWDAGVEPCSMPYSDGRMSMESDYITFYESSGPVTEVVIHTESKITIYSELFGEGEYYTNVRTLELSDDGSFLTDPTIDYDIAWSRCSDN
ncbi:MAG: hypothetical protein SWY16_06745 [Cyanobacteriota bacterium]|nr:hypothetical protein [Cyanobacteriota bacterium]